MITKDEVIALARECGGYRNSIGGAMMFIEDFMLERLAQAIFSKAIEDVLGEPVGEVVQIDFGDEEVSHHAWFAIEKDIQLGQKLYTLRKPNDYP